MTQTVRTMLAVIGFAIGMAIVTTFAIAFVASYRHPAYTILTICLGVPLMLVGFINTGEAIFRRADKRMSEIIASQEKACGRKKRLTLRERAGSGCQPSQRIRSSGHYFDEISDALEDHRARLLVLETLHETPRKKKKPHA